MSTLRVTRSAQRENVVQMHTLDHGVTFWVDIDDERCQFIKGDYGHNGCFDCLSKWGREFPIDGRTWVTV